MYATEWWALFAAAVTTAKGGELEQRIRYNISAIVEALCLQDIVLRGRRHDSHVEAIQKKLKNAALLLLLKW